MAFIAFKTQVQYPRFVKQEAKKIASQVIEYQQMRSEFSEIFEKRTSEEKD